MLHNSNFVSIPWSECTFLWLIQLFALLTAFRCKWMKANASNRGQNVNTALILFHFNLKLSNAMENLFYIWRPQCLHMNFDIRIKRIGIWIRKRNNNEKKKSESNRIGSANPFFLQLTQRIMHGFVFLHTIFFFFFLLLSLAHCLPFDDEIKAITPFLSLPFYYI